MIQDKQQILSNDQAVTASAISTYVPYIGDVSAAIGSYEKEMDLFLNFAVTTTTESGGATTMDMDLVSHTSAPTDATYSVLKALDDVAKATLVAGYARSWNLRGLPLLDYIGVYYTVATANFTAGAFRTWLSPTPFATNVN